MSTEHIVIGVPHARYLCYNVLALLPLLYKQLPAVYSVVDSSDEEESDEVNVVVV